jgi:hypothetical protein
MHVYKMCLRSLYYNKVNKMQNVVFRFVKFRVADGMCEGIGVQG